MASRTTEARLMARASFSSLAATIVDLIAYRLLTGPEYWQYTLAALFGAVVGAITNFLLNRYWAFPSSGKSWLAQVWQYAIASGLTLLGLEASLLLLVERFGLDEKIAWVPAKVFVWLAISYPLHRFVVFVKRDSRVLQRAAAGHEQRSAPLVDANTEPEIGNTKAGDRPDGSGVAKRMAGFKNGFGC